MITYTMYLWLQWAGSFEELLLDEPRSDTPLHLPLAPANGATWVPHPGDSWPWAPHSGTGSDPPVMQVDSRAGAEFINTESVGITVNGTTFNVTHFDDGTPRPHHCPSQGLVCPGVLAVTPKQRKNMQLYSRLTLAPEPNIEAMVRLHLAHHLTVVVVAIVMPPNALRALLLAWVCV